MIPAGATHKQEFYGQVNYFKRYVSYRMNEVSEQLMQEVRWYFWNGTRWIGPELALRSDKFILLEGT